MLKSRLFEAELRKRNEEKQVIEDTKTDIGWGHQIRSYVLDQARIKELWMEWKAATPRLSSMGIWMILSKQA